MKVIKDEAYRDFLDATEVELGTRIKDVRTQPMMPGGRARLRMFARVGSGRPHPRMHFEVPPADDPNPPSGLFVPRDVPGSADALSEQIDAAWAEAVQVLDAEDLDDGDAPPGSELYWRNSIRAQRRAAFFKEVDAKIDAWSGELSRAAEKGLRRVRREREAEAFAGSIEYDNADTGTYHSYGEDAPFVHYLETMIDALPAEGSQPMALLHAATRASVRRQRQHLMAHLDFLMRNKYAHDGIDETDIERSLGGFLIDRKTRVIASEEEDEESMVPRYELLRIDPGAEHDHAGQWIYRDAGGVLHLQDGTAVTAESEDIRSAPREPEELTFRRAPGDPSLRKGVRFDWDENGYVQAGKLDWVSWSGHCDVKAVMEQLGVTLTDDPPPSVEEYRSDTGETTVYDRDLLLEMVASVLEFGSYYVSLDETGWVERGIAAFGGSRNDAEPDRLQFKGTGRGRSVRWPDGLRQEAFSVRSITWPDGTEADMDTVFFRSIPDTDAVDFARNPRFLKTVEGDYNVIDVSGAVIEARALVDSVDPRTGYLEQKEETTKIDLRDDAQGRFFLGTYIDEAEDRRLSRVYWDPSEHEIVAEAYEHERVDGRWAAARDPNRDRHWAMVKPLKVTLSRELKRDNPAQFQALLDIAQREAKNIAADTDKASAVWNGMVYEIRSEKVGSNAEARVEHWRVELDARFGSATLEYLVRRTEDGKPAEYCPAIGENSSQDWPDFLWHEVPDVGTKAFVEGQWVVTEAMLERGIVDVTLDDSVASGFYVHDDHIKNTYEMIFCGLAGYRYTIVHNNKRYGFETKTPWRKAVSALGRLRREVGFA